MPQPSWRYYMAHDLILYGAPLLIIMGSIGNLLSFIVLQTPPFWRMPCGFLLSVLAVVDTGVLYTGLLRIWVLTMSKVDIRLQSNISCKIHVFLTYAFPQLSSWTLLLVTVDRVVSVAIPLKSKDICTLRRMVCVWLITTFTILCINIYPLVSYKIHVVYNLPHCISTDGKVDAFRSVFAWVDFCAVVLIPFLVISSCNLFMIIRLLQAKGRRRILSVRSCSAGKSRLRNGHSVNAMLIFLGVAFLATSIPRSVYFLGLPNWPHSSWEDHERNGLFYNSVILVYNISNSINFLLYCVSGSRFRMAMKTLFCRRDCCQSWRSPEGPIHFHPNKTFSEARISGLRACHREMEKRGMTFNAGISDQH